MPRTSKAMVVLDRHEAALKADHQRLIAQLAGIEAAIERVEAMRRDMTALPKRASRAKARGTAPAPTAVNSDTKATAA